MEDAQKVLAPLRELYRQDTNNRKLIAEYANNFKKRGVFLRSEVDFLAERLSAYNIELDASLLKVKLLTVELVPSTCWFSNVRDRVSKSTWDFLRQSTYKQANFRCEVCGGRGNKWPVECHEIWHYDEHRRCASGERNYVQSLQGLIALCPSCHEAKHIGLAGIRGRGELAETHLATVNGWSEEQTKAYLEEVWQTWRERSRHQWNLELSWLEQYGIVIPSKK
jgi:5-methylcytosine-specific restriction endonuclease McrA